MRNAPDKSCRENQNTHFMFSRFFLKSYRLWDNVEKYCRAVQATDDSMVHAHCMLDNWGYKSFSTQVRGFKPGRSRRIFKGEKILSTPSFGGEVKPSVPCRRFAACKRSLNVMWKSAFRQNYRILFSPIKFHISLLGSLTSRRTWRHLAVTMGTSKTRGEQGSTTSLKAAVQLGHLLRALIYKNTRHCC
jgi:hypothetical protein